MEPQTSTSLLTNLLETLVTHVTNQVITVMEPRLVAMQQQLDAPRKDVLEFDETFTAWMDDNFDLSDHGFDDAVDQWMTRHFSIADYGDLDSQIDNAVGTALDNLDLTDAISEAISNHDFEEAISDGIANADFSNKISDGVKDLSFSVTVN